MSINLNFTFVELDEGTVLQALCPQQLRSQPLAREKSWRRGPDWMQWILFSPQAWDWEYSATLSSDNLISAGGGTALHLPPPPDCGNAGGAADNDQRCKN